MSRGHKSSYATKLVKTLHELGRACRSGFRAKFTFRILFLERGAPQDAEPLAFFELIRFGASTVARMFTTVGSAICAAAS